MPSSERIVSVPGKSELSNYGSHFAHVVRGPGLNELHYASGRFVSGQRPQGRLRLLKIDGAVVEASRTKCEWKPWVIEAEFEFPDGPQVSQRSWVEDEFAHSAIAFRGELPEGCVLIADGLSYAAAKALVSPNGSVMIEEMDPTWKPLVLEIAASITPSRYMLSTEGRKWFESDFAWSEEPVHYRMVFDGLPREMTLSAHVSRVSDFVPDDDWTRSRQRERNVEQAWLKFYAEDVPDIECPEQKYRDLMQFCWYVQQSGAMTPGEMLPYPLVLASKMGFPMWWMADSAFIAIVDAWMRDPSLATGGLLNDTILQSAKGAIPDAAGAYVADNGNMVWVSPEQIDDSPPSTSMCAVGMAAWDIYSRTGDEGFVKRIYPHLVKYERWLLEHKASGVDPDLMAYHYWTDVSWDDSKRWGKSGYVPSADWELPVIPVDGNVFLMLMREALAEMASLLGEEDWRSEFHEKAVRTGKAIEQYLWNEGQGFYFDLLPSGRMLDVWTPAGLMPMMAGIPSKEKYQRLRAHLLNPDKFWTKCGLPTLAIDDPDCAYEDRWWRGGTWPVANWMVIEGLFKYDPEIGRRLLQVMVDMMTRDGFPTCFEYYTPIKGDPKGAIDQGWGAMPVDVILRRIFGLNPNPSGLELKPFLPADWPEALVRNVFAAGTRVEVRYLQSGSGWKAFIKNTGKRGIDVTAGSSHIFLEPGHDGMLTIP